MKQKTKLNASIWQTKQAKQHKARIEKEREKQKKWQSQTHTQTQQIQKEKLKEHLMHIY